MAGHADGDASRLRWGMWWTRCALHAGLEAVPPWMGYSEAELAEAVLANSKQRPNQSNKELAALAGLLPKVPPLQLLSWAPAGRMTRCNMIVTLGA